jgi:hypothetical protein
MVAHDLCHSVTVEPANAYKQFYPSRASLREPQSITTGSNDWVERSILIEKTERAYSTEKATKARSDTTNLQYSIVNIQFPDKAGSPLRYDRLSLSRLGNIRIIA